MNIFSFLYPAAYVGGGFINGQQQAQDRFYRNQEQALTLQNNNLAYQQNLDHWQRLQAALRMGQNGSNPVGNIGALVNGNPSPSPTDISAAAGFQDQGLQANGQPAPTQQDMGNLATPSGNPEDVMYDNFIRTNNARFNALNEAGLYSDAQPYAVNAMNAMSEKSMAGYRRQMMGVGATRQAQLGYGMVGGAFRDVADADTFDPQQFERARMQVVSSGLLTPQQAQMLNQLPATQENAKMLADQGMNAYQAAEIKTRQATQRATDNYRDAQLRNEQRRLEIAQQNADRQEVAAQNKEKVGGNTRAPTTSDLAATEPFVAKAFFGDGTVNTKDPAFRQLQQQVTSRALQITRGNKTMDLASATAQAIQEAKANGDFVVARGPSGGMNLPVIGNVGQNKGTPGQYTPHGMTAANAIPFTNQPKEQLVPNRYYTTAQGIFRWTGTGWVR